MRVLHARSDLLGCRARSRAQGRLAKLGDRGCRHRTGPHRYRNRRTHERQYLPLRGLPQYRHRHPRGRRGGSPMKPFRYQRASEIASACELATQPAVKFIAGGTNLVDLMKLQIEAPAQLVDITRLPLDGIEET